MMYALKAFALAVFVACTAAAKSEAEYQTAFTNWMQKHEKSYSSAEFQTRYAVFKSNLDYVNEWNANHENVKLDTNFLADLTNAEYQRIYLGTKINGATRLSKAAASAPVADLPETVDWNAQGAVTPIKDQGQCGSCWSFSTTGGIEGAHYLSTKNLVSCSEQQLVDCSTENGGCNGGTMDAAFQYVIKNKGIVSEESYPYKAEAGKCDFKKKNVVATISKFTDVNSGDESDLQKAVAQQPVSVAIDASHQSFQLYSSGVYDESECSTSQLDHGVLAAGYGTDNGSDYWLVKNSWGAGWGKSGFIWMSRNKENQCGIATMASYPTA